MRHSAATMILLLVLAHASAAQESPAPAGPITTLHLSANTIQLPLLVLSKSKERLGPVIPANLFQIRMNGEWVRPQYVRAEGQDPISLAVLVDTRRPRPESLPKLSSALATFASSSLSSRDRISIFLMGCTTIRMMKNLTPDPLKIRADVDEALKSENALGDGVDCEAGFHLWDSLAYVTSSMESLPGRRVILAVTAGEDKESKTSPLDLIRLSQGDAVTIFGLDPTYPAKKPDPPPDPNNLTFTSVTESSGGLKMDLKGNGLDKQLQTFVKMLRERYIVDLSIPQGSKAGIIQTEARIVGAMPDAYFIRIAGKSVPLPNPEHSDEVPHPVNR